MNIDAFISVTSAGKNKILRKERSMKAGTRVTLKPTEGAYQKSKSGTVTRTSRTLMFVLVDGEHCERKFRLDGSPYGPYGRQFPRYIAKPAEGAQ